MPYLFSIALTSDIEKLASLASLKQLWYLDDGLLLLEEDLPARGLRLNRAKCELLTSAATLPYPEFLGIPLLSTTTDWCFLGAPLTDEVGISVAAATSRALEVTDKLASRDVSLGGIVYVAVYYAEPLSMSRLQVYADRVGRRALPLLMEKPT